MAAPLAATGTSSAAAPTSLLGYNPANTVINENTDNIDYQLAAGQTEAANIGPYLDFNTVTNPQPIRGTVSHSIEAQTLPEPD